MGNGVRTFEQPRHPWRGGWIAVLVSSSVSLSLFFACATPFAALATFAALKLPRRDGLVAIGLVWLANQAIGYGILGYPWRWDSAAWGIAIGLSGLLAILTARAFVSRRPVRLAISLPFVGAFAAYELGLYCAGYVLPGAAGGFTASVVQRIFLINLATLLGLLILYRLGQSAGLLARPSEPYSAISVTR